VETYLKKIKNAEGTQASLLANIQKVYSPDRVSSNEVIEKNDGLLIK